MKLNLCASSRLWPNSQRTTLGHGIFPVHQNYQFGQTKPAQRNQCPDSPFMILVIKRRLWIKVKRVEFWILAIKAIIDMDHVDRSIDAFFKMDVLVSTKNPDALDKVESKWPTTIAGARSKISQLQEIETRGIQNQRQRHWQQQQHGFKEDDIRKCHCTYQEWGFGSYVLVFVASRVCLCGMPHNANGWQRQGTGSQLWFIPNSTP